MEYHLQVRHQYRLELADWETIVLAVAALDAVAEEAAVDRVEMPAVDHVEMTVGELDVEKGFAIVVAVDSMVDVSNLERSKGAGSYLMKNYHRPVQPDFVIVHYSSLQSKHSDS